MPSRVPPHRPRPVPEDGWCTPLGELGEGSTGSRRNPRSASGARRREDPLPPPGVGRAHATTVRRRCRAEHASSFGRARRCETGISRMRRGLAGNIPRELALAAWQRAACTSSRGTWHRGEARRLLADGRRKRGEPQDRQRDATSPQRVEQRKPSGWCETTKAEQDPGGWSPPGRSAVSPPRGSGCSACTSMEGCQARRRSRGPAARTIRRRLARPGATATSRGTRARTIGYRSKEERRSRRSCLIRPRAGPARTIRPDGRPGDGSGLEGSSEGHRAAPDDPFVINSVDPRWKTSDLEDPANLRS